MSNIIPHRIRMARQAQGLSMDKLVEKMGSTISKMSISKIERGVFAPSQDMLCQIAQACKVPVSYFYSKEQTIRDFDFRIKGGAPAHKTKQIEAQLKTKIEEYCDIENALNLPPTKFVNPFSNRTLSSYDDAENAAAMLRQLWQVGRQPILSVYELLQENGIMIIELPIDCKGLVGTSTMVNNEIPVIIINTNENTNERKRFTALHELAHLLFCLQPADTNERVIDHPYGSVTIKPIDEERMCECFASAMLMPRETMTRRLGASRKNITLNELISIRNLYGISISGAVHRAHDLAIISDSAYNNWYTNKINKNHMEEGWGCYPINEVADRHQLLMERMKTEYNN